MKNFLAKIKKIFNLSVHLANISFILRNEGSAIGIFWYLIEPLSFFGVLIFIGGAFNTTPIEKYPLYLFLGIIMFNFLSTVLSNSSSVIKDNSGYIKSFKIQSEAFVFSTYLKSLYAHFFEIALFAFAIVCLGGNLLSILYYIPVFFFFSLFVIGVSFIFATVGVFIIDWANVWNILSRLIWFATPVFYTTKNSSSVIAIFNTYNPIAYYLDIGREMIIYNRIPSLYLLFSLFTFSIIVFIVGLIFFEKNKKKFAEKI